jgi:hypothetical protein
MTMTGGKRLGGKPVPYQNVGTKIQIDCSGIETGPPWRLCYIACARSSCVTQERLSYTYN